MCFITELFFFGFEVAETTKSIAGGAEVIWIEKILKLFYTFDSLTEIRERTFDISPNHTRPPPKPQEFE